MHSKGPLLDIKKNSTGTYNSKAKFSMTKILQHPKGFLIYSLKVNTSQYVGDLDSATQQ
jgi:hypothetical protein